MHSLITAYVALGIVAAPMATAVTKTPKQDSQVKVEADPLVRGILAVRGQFKHVTPAFARKIVKEVRELLARPGNKWIKPHELIGLAINESDLRSWLKRGLDCGITQVRVNYLAKYRYGQRKLCNKLASSTKLAFEYAIAALNRIHHRYCRHWTGKQHQRCLQNVYFQGPSVRNRRKCDKRKRTVFDTAETIVKRWRVCMIDYRYHLRALCFAEGVRLARKARQSCRRATSYWWIKTMYKRKGVRKPLTQASLRR